MRYYCDQLRLKDVNKQVVLKGWINTIRVHSNIIFVDLRDIKGVTQLVFDLKKNIDFRKNFVLLKPESVIGVKGLVKEREKNNINKNLLTGEIEVFVLNLKIYSICKNNLPFNWKELNNNEVQEELRFKYRYLDLRNNKNLNKIIFRHKLYEQTRKFLNKNGFLEIELPTLTKSTPEGAREFLVPSRLKHDHFYALSQSPQQYKQILMVSGIDKYYSIAKCFRDEDLRSDRQFEFTQIDLEMSFVDKKDIMKVIEKLIKQIFKYILNQNIKIPFKKINYDEAINKFGTDKPDLRLPFEIKDITNIFKKTNFKIFKDLLSNNGIIRALNIKGLLNLNIGNKEFKIIENIATENNYKGIFIIKCIEENKLKSPFIKFLDSEEIYNIKNILSVEKNDVIFLLGDIDYLKLCETLGKIRTYCLSIFYNENELIKNNFSFLWVINFPLFYFDKDKKYYLPVHHPFTSPRLKDLKKLDKNPEKIIGEHYDIVLNGVEIGGGSIRINDFDLQKKIFKEFLKIDEKNIDGYFGHLLESFNYGAPPHGGIALGLDRICAILTNSKSIKEVIAFPKNQKGEDLLFGAPTKLNIN